MTNKTTKLIMGTLFLGIIMLSFASAGTAFWACFQKGQIIHYCSHYKPDETYNNNYPLCMETYRAADDCYVQGVWNACLKTRQTCSTGGGNSTNSTTTFDLTPPVLNIFSPLNTTISKSKSVLLNFSVNEIADVYYKDINKNTGTWIKVCTKCRIGNLSNPSYAKLRSFAEGQNNLMFKAVDAANNIAYVNVKFFIDSTKPMIYTTEPRLNEFADGTFTVQFKELNPKKLTLHYGNDTVNMNISKCYYAMTKENCDISVNLTKYNGQTIVYFFEIEDIAGNKYSSRSVAIKVDTKNPVVKNPSSFYNVSGRYVTFNISIDEPNLYKVSFVNTLNPKSTSTTLCTSLNKGYCYRKQYFSPGNYSLSIQISDKAGHSIAIPATFKII